MFAPLRHRRLARCSPPWLFAAVRKEGFGHNRRWPRPHRRPLHPRCDVRRTQYRMALLRARSQSPAARRRRGVGRWWGVAAFTRLLLRHGAAHRQGETGSGACVRACVRAQPLAPSIVTLLARALARRPRSRGRPPYDATSSGRACGARTHAQQQMGHQPGGRRPLRPMKHLRRLPPAGASRRHGCGAPASGARLDPRDSSQPSSQPLMRRVALTARCGRRVWPRLGRRVAADHHRRAERAALRLVTHQARWVCSFARSEPKVAFSTHGHGRPRQLQITTDELSAPHSGW